MPHTSFSACLMTSDKVARAQFMKAPAASFGHKVGSGLKSRHFKGYGCRCAEGHKSGQHFVYLMSSDSSVTKEVDPQRCTTGRLLSGRCRWCWLMRRTCPRPHALRCCRWPRRRRALAMSRAHCWTMTCRGNASPSVPPAPTGCPLHRPSVVLFHQARCRER